MIEYCKIKDQNTNITKSITAKYIINKMVDVPYHLWYKHGEYKEPEKSIMKRLESQRGELDNLLPHDNKDVNYLLEQLGYSEEITGGFDNGNAVECLRFHMSASKDNMQKVWDVIHSNNLPSKTHQKNPELEDEVEQEEDFYTPALPELIEARKDILKFSIQRGKKRLDSQRVAYKKTMPEILLERRKFNQDLKGFSLEGTQVLGTRPISSAQFSNRTENIVAGNWCGEISLLNKNLEIIKTVNGHEGKVGAAKWTPNDELIVTVGEDGAMNMYNNTLSEVFRRIDGHENRITDLDIHPSGKYLATSSFDLTWKLWDIERGVELLQQEGHSKELYCVGFQKDGSLVSSAGIDRTAIIWDLRSGRSVLNLKGHIKPIFAMDWSLDGYTVATGGADGLIYIWDLRNTTSNNHQIAAHNSIVTSLKFDKDRDFSLISAGFDNKINTYSKDNYIKIGSLEGHTDKILTVDIDNETKTIISGGYDRSLKIWSR